MNKTEMKQEYGTFTDINEICDIIASANMGIWRIEVIDGEEPRMHVDDTMKKLLGIEEGVEHTPEETYRDWYTNITLDAAPSVHRSIERMKKGYYDENTYLWKHPTKGVRYVRCGGTAKKTDGGFIIRGYHYDVDSLVRREKEQAEELENALNKKDEYYATLGSLEGIFYSLHMIDLVEDTAVEYNSKNAVRQYVSNKSGAKEMMKNVMSALTVDSSKAAALEFTDLSTIPERMKNVKVISKQLKGVNIGWFLATFVVMERDAEGTPVKVIYSTRVIDEAKKYEKKLIEKSQTDEITGLLNRRAYEEDIYANNDRPHEDDFVYISIDVNGLKNVNDTKGHTAGDELIVGSCQCMKKCLGPYGKLYRIGGDEFVAILSCDEKKLKKILADFDDTLAKWSGKLVDKLSVSYGHTSKEEHPDLSVRQLGAIAEQRMYVDKENHYKKNGVDRRGQKDAHKALCDLYTKILKINVTDDSYQIIDMDMSEQTEEKGFSDTISKWLISFGESGQVHPNDLKEYLRHTDIQYLRDYFAGNKTSLHIIYRRKFGEEYKQVMMEIIPANDYSTDSQSLFLYVKNIDI